MANPLLPGADDDTTQPNPLTAAVLTNPVGTQYYGGQTMQSATPIDPIRAMGSNGTPVVQSQVDAARQQMLDAHAQVMATVIGMAGSPLKLPGGALVRVAAPSEDVANAVASNFEFGRSVGPATVPLKSLSGGVAMSYPVQAARVSALQSAIASPDGYFSRPIVDAAGNVVEGQHRIEALRQMGVKNVPVYKVQDLAEGVDVPGLKAAISGAQSMHPDQVHQLAGHILNNLADEGSAANVRDAYEPPQGYAPGWNAALDFLDK